MALASDAPLSIKNTSGVNRNIALEVDGSDSGDKHLLTLGVTSGLITDHISILDFLGYSSGTIPTLTTNQTHDLLLSSMISGGNVTSTGGQTITAHGSCWSTTSNPPTLADSHTTIAGGSIGTFDTTISVIPGNWYYIRAYATNIKGTAYGDPRRLNATIPTQYAPTLIDYYSFNLNFYGYHDVIGWYADVSSDNFSTFFWENHNIIGDVSGAVVDGITPGTRYYCRVRAYNGDGITFYSNVVYIDIPPAPTTLYIGFNLDGSIGLTGLGTNVITINVKMTTIASQAYINCDFPPPGHALGEFFRDGGSLNSCSADESSATSSNRDPFTENTITFDVENCDSTTTTSIYYEVTNEETYCGDCGGTVKLKLLLITKISGIDIIKIGSDVWQYP